MSNDKVLLRRIIMLILVMIQLIIIGFWKRGGEISSDIYSVLVVVSTVLFILMVNDVRAAWSMTKNKKQE